MRPPDDDVRVQQALLRAARRLLRPSLQAVVGRCVRGGVDFRAVRFPGLISAVTVPSGGTSDTRRNDSRGRQRRALCVFCAAGYPYPVHGDARCRRSAARVRQGATGGHDEAAYNLGAFAPTAEKCGRKSFARFRRPTSRFMWTRSGRASSIPGPKTPMILQREGLGIQSTYDFTRDSGLPDPFDQTTVRFGRE